MYLSRKRIATQIFLNHSTSIHGEKYVQRTHKVFWYKNPFLTWHFKKLSSYLRWLMPTEVVWENYCRVVMSHHQGKSNDHTNTAPTPAAATALMIGKIQILLRALNILKFRWQNSTFYILPGTFLIFKSSDMSHWLLNEEEVIEWSNQVHNM